MHRSPLREGLKWQEQWGALYSYGLLPPEGLPSALHSQRGTAQHTITLGRGNVLCVVPKLQIYILGRKWTNSQVPLNKHILP